MGVLRDLKERIMDFSSFDEVIFGGDFNWDRTRYNGFVSCLDRWAARVGLEDLWDTFPVNYTHIHTDLKTLSTLDRYLLSPGLLPYVHDAGVLHFRDGDNPSRHSPIMIRIAMDSIPVKKQVTSSTPRRPAWYKADEEQVSHYTSILNDKLASMVTPASRAFVSGSTLQIQGALSSQGQFLVRYLDCYD